MPMSKDEVLLTQDEESLGGEALVFSIPQEFIGERVDKVLRQLYPELSRAQWQRLVREGQVTLQGSPIRANYKVIGGESIQALLPPPLPTDIIPEEIPIDIIYEDETMLAINKPAGIVMHPATGHESGTVANAIVYHFPDVLDVGGERRPGLVHRLDKETSGVVLIAKKDQAMQHLVGQFKDREIKKVYLALVEGHIRPESALIDAPIGRDPADRKRMAVIEAGRSLVAQASQTRYELTRAYAEHSLVTCYPVTGRTHQIRVHLAFIGFPIAGDRVYGRRRPTLSLSRHFLHAHQITFRRPLDDQHMTLSVPLPPELQAVLDGLEAG